MELLASRADGTTGLNELPFGFVWLSAGFKWRHPNQRAIEISPTPPATKNENCQPIWVATATAANPSIAPTFDPELNIPVATPAPSAGTIRRSP